MERSTNQVPDRPIACQPREVQAVDDETSSLVGALLVWLLIGVVVTLLGARDLFEAWTEDCLVGTEHQRCTEGQGRVTFGVGLAITIPSAFGLLLGVLRQ